MKKAPQISATNAWEVTRKRILRRDHGFCQACGERGRLSVASQVDHIIPVINGGTDDDGNLRAVCIDCSEAKASATDAEVLHRPWPDPESDPGDAADRMLCQ